jgi:hypothetical protein
MKTIYLILLFFTVMILPNCKKPEVVEPYTPTESNIFTPRFDLSNAKAIFTIDHHENDENTYKITSDNKIEIVKYINTDGTTIYENPIDSCIVNIYDFFIASEFLIVKNFNEVVWNEYGSQPYYNRNTVNIIDKTTGTANKIISLVDNIFFNMTSNPNPFLDNYKIQKSNNNFYFEIQDIVYKYNQIGLAEQYSPVGKELSLFKVNLNDDIIYKEADGEYKIKKSSGGLISISNKIEGAISAFWLGLDGSFYISRHNYTPSGSSEYIDKIEINGEDISIINIANYDFNKINNSYSYKQELLQSVLFIPKNHSNESKPLLFNETLKSIQDVSSYFPDCSEVIDVDNSAGYFYIATNDNLYKFDLNLNYTQLLDVNQYKVQAMCVNENNNTIFSALRNSDGKYIIGTIDNGGSVNIIDDIINKPVTNIEFL